MFTENIETMHMNKTKIILINTIYTRMSILNILKQLIYDFYDNVMRSKYRENIDR